MSEGQRSVRKFREACWRERMANAEDCKQKFLAWLCDDNDDDATECPSGPVQVLSHEYLAITSDQGLRLIAEERLRQMDVHGYDEAHDDEHDRGELVKAAQCYMMPHVRSHSVSIDEPPHGWPFEPEVYHIGDSQIDRLTKAAAFIAAEISRLKRAEDSRR